MCTLKLTAVLTPWLSSFTLTLCPAARMTLATLQRLWQTGSGLSYSDRLARSYQVHKLWQICQVYGYVMYNFSKLLSPHWLTLHASTV
jgi:hypothetical protein